MNEELEIIKHSLGYDEYFRYKSRYRNYYCCVINGENYSTLKNMVEERLMKKRVVINNNQDQYFHVTEKGIKYLKDSEGE